MTARDRRLAYPLCIAGARACPPEDCGGAFGYEGLITALADPKHDEHDQMVKWVGGHIRPGLVDANAVNRLFSNSQ